MHRIRGEPYTYKTANYPENNFRIRSRGKDVGGTIILSLWLRVRIGEKRSHREVRSGDEPLRHLTKPEEYFNADGGGENKSTASRAKEDVPAKEGQRSPGGISSRLR